MTIRTGLIAAMLAGAAVPVSAQEPGGLELPPLLQRGLGMMLRRMAPELEPLGDLLSEMPLYAPPEILPNGDIIIRRRPRLPEPPPPGQIDL